MGSHARRVELSQSRLRHEARFFESHGYLPRPRLVQWLATLRCGLSCPHCLAAISPSPAGGGPGRGEFADMPLPAALDLVGQAADLGVSQMLVTGGEPLARADLGEVIARLGRRKLPWSLNTAAMPSREHQRAIEANPPAFVAVSVDGPAGVHDSFRGRAGAFDEAMQSIRYFRSLGIETAAGTTVTRFNFGSLPQTFRVVLDSGASAWGIHLAVPEGRAAGRRDMMLTRKQLGQLLRFVARKRSHFPVTMADEFGYCGDWEPLVRDGPFRCGAGLAQCVVLPDGHVVPCTTLDRSASAGNLRDLTLAEIWREGFAEIRNWRPAGVCGKCKYSPACAGGCWLMRRKATTKQCYREVWHVPAAMKTAAGIAICLGVLAGSANAAEPPDPQPKVAGLANPPTTAPELSPAERDRVVRQAEGFDHYLTSWMLGEFSPNWQGGSRVPRDAEPVYKVMAEVWDHSQPDKLDEVAPLLRDAQKTNIRSLSVPTMLYRILGQWTLDHPPADRRAEETDLLVKLTAELQTCHEQWRKEIFRNKLDQYLVSNRQMQGNMGMVSKAVHLPPHPTPLDSRRQLLQDTQAERWGGPETVVYIDPTVKQPENEHAPNRFRYERIEKQANVEALDGWLERHPLADGMELTVTADAAVKAARLNASGKAALKPADRLGIYDFIVTPKDAGEQTITLKSAGRALAIKLPPGATLSYLDLLQLAYAQHQADLDKAAGKLKDDLLKPKPGPTIELATDPLLFGPMHKISRDAATAKDPGLLDVVNAARFSGTWLVDFWMF